MRERLAVEGGRPVRERFLPYGHHHVDEADIRAVVGVLRSDWLTTGPMVPKFEETFAAKVGSRYAVALSSGTAALHGAVFAAGIGTGDEVITTPLTFVASANCVLYQDGTPVFADIQADTLNIDPTQVAIKITSRTRAIIPVDFAGQAADYDELAAIAEEHGLVVIEDAAHALGATYKSRNIGTMATMTVFSLHPVKHITSGEGGVVTTDDPELARRLRIFRNHGITSEVRERLSEGAWLYEMAALGYNYRLTDVQCALALSQLDKLEAWLARRRAIAARYNAAFCEMPELEPPVIRADRDPAWHIYVIRLNLARLRVGRAEVFRALRAENIGVNVHYILVTWHPYYQKLGHTKGEVPAAEEAYERVLTLPLFPGMDEVDVEDVIVAVQKVVAAYRR